MNAILYKKIFGCDNMSINSRIKTIRIAKGLTLQQLSERTGVTKGYLSKVENSTSPPSGFHAC